MLRFWESDKQHNYPSIINFVVAVRKEKSTLTSTTCKKADVLSFIVCEQSETITIVDGGAGSIIIASAPELLSFVFKIMPVTL